MPLIDHLPGLVRHAVGETFAPRLDNRLPGDSIAVQLDRVKAAEMLMSAGMGPYTAEATDFRVIADPKAIPRRVRRQIARGERDGDVVITNTEGRNIFRPLNPRRNQITINLTTIPQALEQSADALLANEQAIGQQNAREAIRATEAEEEPFVALSARESIENSVQSRVDAAIAMEARRLAHQRWHHRIRPVVAGAAVGGIVAPLGRLVATVADGRLPITHIPNTPFTVQGLLTFAGGWAAAATFNRVVMHPRHVRRTDEATATYLERHGNDSVLHISLRRPQERPNA